MKRLQRFVFAWPLLVLVIVSGFWAGCQHNPPLPGGGGLSITQAQIGNKITIRFTEPGIPSPWEQRIDESGMISLPFGRSVEAAGKTKSELEQAIRDIYIPELYNRMTVVVDLEDRFYFVKGEVRNPGQLKYISSMTVLSAITAAGDYNPYADRGHVRLVRNGETFRISDNKFDTPILPGDTIIVDRRF